MQNIIYHVIADMTPYLEVNQLQMLQKVLIDNMAKGELKPKEISNDDYVKRFVSTKLIEGCSEATIRNYMLYINKLLEHIDKKLTEITANDIRDFLIQYQSINNCQKSSLDTIRRCLSSLFAWMENEDYLLKSPLRRVNKIKAPKKVKHAFSNEDITKLKDACTSVRDRAIVDLLYSSGIRIQELENLNIEDVDIEKRECIVYGKGSKERIVYFNSEAKVHLKQYLSSRTDNEPALFLTLRKPNRRLSKRAVQEQLKSIGIRSGIEDVHAHKFRTTMATQAIKKGMKIEQVKHILGHSQIDTTLQYALVDDEDAKRAHSKLL